MLLCRRARMMAAGGCVSLLVACGGGGGSDSSGNALPRIVQDSNPSSGVSAADMFPMSLGDYTTSDVLDADGKRTGKLVTQSVAGLSGAVFQLEERSDDTSEVDKFEYVQTPQGLAQTGGMFEETPQAAVDIIGQVLVYPNTLYPIGATRTAVRQGNWGEDLDGDGKNESFRLELSQEVLGEETITIPISSTPVQVLHFRTVMSQRIQPTKAGLTAVEVKTTVDDYVLRGVGIVRSQKRYDGTNVELPSDQLTLIKSAKAGGTQFGPVLVEKAIIEVGMPAQQVVYVPALDVFLIAIPTPTSDPHSGAVAVIDGTTGQVKGYSASLAPRSIEAMKVSSDGTSVYLALTDSFGISTAAIVRMSLSVGATTATLTEQMRLELPLGMLPSRLAVSPADPGLLVLSAVSTDSSLEGVYVVRDLVLGARIPTPAGGLAFSQDGTRLITFDMIGSALSEVSLHHVVHDSLVTADSIALPSGSDVGIAQDVALNRVYIANRWFSFDDLSTAPLPGDSCRVMSGGDRLVCLASNSATRVDVRLLDASNGESLFTRRIDVPDSGIWISGLVPGQAGTLAVRQGYTRLFVTRDPQLQ